MNIPIENEKLHNPTFKDGQVVVAEGSHGLEIMFCWLCQKSLLQISLQKTQYLVVISSANFDIQINNNVYVDQIDLFRYLD